MPQNVLLRKLRSARYRARAKMAEWREAAREAQKRRAVDAWIALLRDRPPQVLIGANFADHGGVREHILSIGRYSSLRTELVPSDRLLKLVVPHEIKTKFNAAFCQYRASGVLAVHSHVFPWFIEWCNALRSPRPLWVHTYHAPYFPNHRNGEHVAWQEEFNSALVNVARNADVRISVSKWQQRYLSEAHGIETLYIPNGVDVAFCDTADPVRFTGTVQWGKFVLYVGRNDPVKNPHEFLRLAAALPSLRFMMAGRDLSLERLASETGIAAPGNLTVRGEMSHQQVIDAVAACSAVVVTSLREGLPTVVLEAMTLRKPVVVPDEPGCVEAIDGGRLGHVYRPGDILDLREKTLAALSDPSRGDAGREFVLREFDWRVIAPRLDAIYESGPARSSSRARKPD
ncbi:MAG: glycosyltransferase family 4 protein [Gemmatimonadales bacterium]